MCLPSEIDSATDNSLVSSDSATSHLLSEADECATHRHVRCCDRRLPQHFDDFRVGESHFYAGDDGFTIIRTQALKGGFVSFERLLADGLLER
jgi:hypothetical protein